MRRCPRCQGRGLYRDRYYHEDACWVCGWRDCQPFPDALTEPEPVLPTVIKFKRYPQANPEEARKALDNLRPQRDTGQPRARARS